jgi:hypothetical protein
VRPRCAISCSSGVLVAASSSAFAVQSLRVIGSIARGDAECAKLDVLVTLNQELIRGLARRVENIWSKPPSEALKRAGGYATLE